MKTWIVSFMVFLPLTAFAKDGWVCEEEASVKDGEVYSVCGIGESMEEGYARTRALQAAFTEFDLICGASSDCHHRPNYVVPKRTTCERSKQGLWKCYRLIEVTLKPR